MPLKRLNQFSMSTLSDHVNEGRCKCLQVTQPLPQSMQWCAFYISFGIKYLIFLGEGGKKSKAKILQSPPPFVAFSFFFFLFFFSLRSHNLTLEKPTQIPSFLSSFSSGITLFFLEKKKKI